VPYSSTEFLITAGSAPQGISSTFDNNIWFTESAGNRIGRLFVLTPSGVTAKATALTPFTGTVATFTDGDPSSTPADFAAMINWGIGSAGGGRTGGTITKSGSVFTVSGSYTYAYPGTYWVSVSINRVTGGNPVVSPWGSTTVGSTIEVAPFAPRPLAFSGVAKGDVSGDGVPDRVVGARSGRPRVRVFDGQTGRPLVSFLAYGRTSPFGALVRVVDVNGDGYAEILTRQGRGGSRVLKVFDGTTGKLLSSFRALPADPSRKVSLTLADRNTDGRLDLVVRTRIGRRRVTRVFNLLTGALQEERVE
jgi:hypothetical protein